MPKSFFLNLASASVTLTLMTSLSWAEGPFEAERYVYGPHMGWSDDGWSLMFFGPMFMVLLLVLLIVAAVLAVRWAGGPWLGPEAQHRLAPPPTPHDILRARFARGEIEKDEFEARSRVLGE